MTHAEKLALLTQWQADIETANALIEPIAEALCLNPESPMHTAVWGLQDALTKATAALVGDKHENLDWFANENNFGRKAMDAGLLGNLRPIATLTDLIWLMELEA